MSIYYLFLKGFLLCCLFCWFFVLFFSPQFLKHGSGTVKLFWPRFHRQISTYIFIPKGKRRAALLQIPRAAWQLAIAAQAATQPPWEGPSRARELIQPRKTGRIRCFPYWSSPFPSTAPAPSLGRVTFLQHNGIPASCHKASLDGSSW